MPHKVLSFNFSNIIYPAENPTEKPAKERKSGYPQRVVNELSDKTIYKLVELLKQCYNDYLLRPLNPTLLKPFYKKINKRRHINTRDKLLRNYFGKNPEANVSTWSNRLKNYLGSILLSQYSEVFRQRYVILLNEEQRNY